LLAGCGVKPPVSTGTHGQVPEGSRCLVVLSQPGASLERPLAERLVTTILPGCRQVWSGAADIIAELSWTQRPAALEIVDGANGAKATRKPRRRIHGIVYGLGLTAQEAASGRTIADVKTTQRFRRARKPGDLAGLAERLAWSAAHTPPSPTVAASPR
jgi:hypothetical protein